MSSEESWLYPSFSHIYVEERAAPLESTQAVLARFPEARVVPIREFGEVFSRGYQNWRAQKSSPKLVLACRQDSFMYHCSDLGPGFGDERFYYNTMMMNCIYDCDYCYLQGMFPSANLVMFLNLPDFFQATDRALENHPIHLCLSYHTDLLATESIFGYVRAWVEFVRTRPDLLVEVRTKSANYHLLADLKPTSNCILAWTLSPSEIAARFEPEAPDLKQRLESLKQAMQDGWQVRLCFDPLLMVANWEDIYSTFMKSLESELDWSKIRDASVGVFRMNKDHLKRIQRQRQDSPVIHYRYKVHKNIASYGADQRAKLIGLVAGHLRRLLPDRAVVEV